MIAVLERRLSMSQLGQTYQELMEYFAHLKTKKDRQNASATRLRHKFKQELKQKKH